MNNRIIRTLIALLLLTCSATAGAQFRYGPTAGVTISTLHFKQDLFSVNQAVGGLAGITAEMMFPGVGFGIDFGMEYELRGAFTNLGERKIWASQGYGREHAMLHNLVIPVHLRFKWTRLNGFEDYLAPFVYGGPEFGFTLAHSDIKAFEYAGGEVGLAAGIGVEIMKRWQISAAHCWGVTYTLRTVQLTNLSAQNRTWNVRVAYLF